MDSFAKGKADNKCEIWTDIKKRTLFSLVYRDKSWKYKCVTQALINKTLKQYSKLVLIFVIFRCLFPPKKQQHEIASLLGHIP